MSMPGALPGLQDVLQVLRGAASGDAQVRVPAHRHLQELETRPGFVRLLLEAYADASGDAQGRLLAVLTCKNVIDRQWQPRAGHCSISGEEKAYTKECLLKLLKVAVAGGLPHLVELALVLRRICRFEFPRQWEELVHFMVAELQLVQEHGFTDTALGVILVLHHVLKEQATKKLITARREFHQLGQVLTRPLGAVWCMKLEHMKQEPRPEEQDGRMWRLSRYLDGCFLILLCRGCAHLHDAPDGPHMVLLVKEKVSLLLGLLRAGPFPLHQRPFFAKNVKSALKWWASLLHDHPLAFTRAGVGDVLHAGVEVLLWVRASSQATADPGLVQLSEGLARSSLQLLTHGFGTIAYRRGPQPAHEGATLEAAAACHAQFAAFVQRHGVDALCDLCCGVAFQFSHADLQAFLNDPEDQLQGPGSQTELHIAGEKCVHALGQQPHDMPLIEHIARRMQEEALQPPAVGDSFAAVLRRDALLQLLSLCQALLRPHLQFQQLLGFLVPMALLAAQQTGREPSVLLPVRLCAVVKSWAADIPGGAALPVLQLVMGLLQDGRPKAVRLAALGPLRVLLDRFADHEAMAQLQGPLIDSCLALLRTLAAPEVQWRCLHLVHRFLCEEAANGRYEVTENSLQQLLVLWRQPEEGELLIRHALLDVLRALVLMSDRSRRPSLPLSQPLLSFCLAVISDCYANRLAAGGGGSALGGGCHGNAGADGDAIRAAALDADAAAAAASCCEGASSTLFDSGCALFLGVLRTVDVGQALPLMGLFPRLVAHYGEQPAPSLHDNALDILLEYCALHVAPASGGAMELQRHYGPLARLCHRCLQDSRKGRNSELCLQLLQLMLAHARTPEGAGQLREIVAPLLHHWSANFCPSAGPGSFQYPLHLVVQLLCTWHSHHAQDFRAQARLVLGGSTAHAAALMVACCRLICPIALRASMLSLALSLAEDGGIDDTFWHEFFKCSDALISSTQKKGNSALLTQALQSLKSSLGTKLPAPVRSTCELQRCVLPPELHQSMGDDGSFDEVAVVRWFFDRCAAALRQLSARHAVNLQVLLASAPQQVQLALQGLAGP